MSAPGWLRRHPRLTALALALVLALAADLVLGAFLIRPSAGSFRTLHPYYHHGFLPGVSTTTRWGEREYAMHTNSLGFRDAAPRAVPLEPRGRRVLLIGDSFVEGIGVPWEESFVALLAADLGPAVELLNAAAVSYSPLLYRLKVEYLLQEVGLRFGELVVFIDVSDIQDEVLYQSFEPRRPTRADRWRSTARALLQRHSFGFHALTALQRQREGGISNAFDAEALADNSIYFRDLASYQVEGGQAEVEKGRWEWTIAEPLMEAWGKQGMDLAWTDMRALVRLCRERGIEVTVCVYPSPVQILMKDEDSIQVRAWRRFTEETKVGFIDLWPLFVGEAAGRPRAVYERYFIAGDMHWNGAGHALVARELAGRL
jgi:hypothetical protein